MSKASQKAADILAELKRVTEERSLLFDKLWKLGEQYLDENISEEDHHRIFLEMERLDALIANLNERCGEANARLIEQLTRDAEEAEGGGDSDT